MKEFIDQMKQTIRLSEVPRRIVSLVPSQTELLFYLGLGDRVVGITKFCIHPDEWYRSKTRVGGTKDVDFEKVKALKPDLIIGNKEENQKENIESLMQIAPIWMSDIFTLEDSLVMMQSLGDVLDVQQEADLLIRQIQTKFNEISIYSKLNQKENLSVLYLIWRNPYLAAGKDTFIDDVLHRIGYHNFITESRYPEIQFSIEKAPDLIFLSSEPYPFKSIHIQELQDKYPTANIQLVDGEMFCWYGSRLHLAPDYFKTLTNSF